jgi:hypothetical protein
MDKILSVIQRYVPQGTAHAVATLICDYRIHLRIKRDRRSKAGDYRGPTPDDPHHRISVNHNLNPYAFLITFIHELAHRKVYEKAPSYIKPHGEEWKREFKILMAPFLTEQVFPADVLRVLQQYMVNPGASSSSDEKLVRVLRRHDTHQKSETLLEDLEAGSLFSLGDDRVFKKGELRRKRYLCECITNRKQYLVSGIAAVFPVVDK